MMERAGGSDTGPRTGWEGGPRDKVPYVRRVISSSDHRGGARPGRGTRRCPDPASGGRTGRRHRHHSELSLAQHAPDDRPAGRHGDEPHDPLRRDHHGGGPGHGPALRLLHGGQAQAVHPGDGPGGRPGRRRRRPHRGDRASLGRVPGRDLRPVAGPQLRAGRRGRGGGQGRQRQPGAHGEHRPGPALGPVVRGLHRGPVPQPADRRQRDRGRAEPARARPGEALRRLQPGDEPQHLAGRRPGQPTGRCRRSTCRRSRRRYSRPAPPR